MDEDTLVLGIDSSTQSTKAALVRVSDGQVVELRSAPHPDGSEVDPDAWLVALDEAAGPLLPRASAIAVAGQQHGMVALDADGEPVRDALLWNDTRSAQEAEALVAELGGPQSCADLTGSVLVASYTATKVRWLRDHEQENAERVARVLLPHDFLTWHLAGRPAEATTDHGDASGTGYYSPSRRAWLPDVAERALGRSFGLPRLAEPHEIVAHKEHVLIAPGTGDNMAAALGLDLAPGDVAVSIGTSGVASAVSASPTADGSGLVSGFADATGRYLPLVCTLNAARILDFAARMLDVDHRRLSELALSADPGAGGVVLLPYFDGERTPNLPDATATLHGLNTRTTPADIARAAVEGLLCSLADALDYLAAATGTPARRVVLIGGGSKSEAVRELAPAIFGAPVSVPPEGEYVALGAARQAAWALNGAAPTWPLIGSRDYEADPTPHVRDAYRSLRSTMTSS